jgi:hypothetical protein
MAAEEGFEDGQNEVIRRKLIQVWTESGGDWTQVARAVVAIRDARERVIVNRIEHYLEDLIEDTGEENPTLTVKDVRDRLFPEVPQ